VSVRSSQSLVSFNSQLKTWLLLVALNVSTLRLSIHRVDLLDSNQITS